MDKKHYQGTDGMNQAGGGNATGKKARGPSQLSAGVVPQTDTGTKGGTSKPKQVKQR